MASPGVHYETEIIDGTPHVYECTKNSRCLVGPAHSSHVILDLDPWLLSDGQITGHVVIRSILEGDAEYDGEIPLILRVAGKGRVLSQVATLTRDESGSWKFALDPEAVLPEHLSDFLSTGIGLELLAELPGYANHPAQLI